MRQRLVPRSCSICSSTILPKNCIRRLKLDPKRTQDEETINQNRTLKLLPRAARRIQKNTGKSACTSLLARPSRKNERGALILPHFCRKHRLINQTVQPSPTHIKPPSITLPTMSSRLTKGAAAAAILLSCGMGAYGLSEFEVSVLLASLYLSNQKYLFILCNTCDIIFILWLSSLFAPSYFSHALARLAALPSRSPRFTSRTCSRRSMSNRLYPRIS